MVTLSLILGAGPTKTSHHMGLSFVQFTEHLWAQCGLNRTGTR